MRQNTMTSLTTEYLEKGGRGARMERIQLPPISKGLNFWRKKTFCQKSSLALFTTISLQTQAYLSLAQSYQHTRPLRQNQSRKRLGPSIKTATATCSQAKKRGGGAIRRPNPSHSQSHMCTHPPAGIRPSAKTATVTTHPMPPPPHIPSHLLQIRHIRVSQIGLGLQVFHPALQESAPFAHRLAVANDAKVPLRSRHGHCT